MADITRDQIVLAQLIVAFGQGAGTLFVSEAAAGTALAHFIPVVPKLVAQWDEVGHQVLEYARTIGRTTGHLAAGRGCGTISEDDFVRGLAKVRAIQQPMGPCPFKHGPGPALLQ